MLHVCTKMLCLIAIWAISLSAIAAEADLQNDVQIQAIGEQIYKTDCATCHGDQGQGNTESFDDPLAGDLSIRELAEIISDTMPEEDPESCVGQQAQAVAAYIHQTFYSPAAQASINPPQIRLGRLTAEQLRQSVADLYGHFGADPSNSDARGISGSYFTGAGKGDDRIRIKRIDDQVEFDFGGDGPGHEIDPREFFIQWNGSLLVPRSGRYEIIVRSTCSFKMQFGRLGPLFFNNHVQSEGKEEFRRSMQLTGGRLYPIQINMQQRKRKTKQPPARMSLSWIPPGGVEAPIPKSHLVPQKSPSTFALQTKLPPDDRSYGYDRGIAVDRAWDQSITEAALEFSEVVVDELFPAYLNRNGGNEDRRDELRNFFTELLQVAFRSSIDQETQSRYIDWALDASGENDADAIRLLVLKCFKSPRFLYPTIDTDQSKSRRAANRLALVLFDSVPSDSWLLRVAKAHQLITQEQFQKAARRMVADYRSQAKIRSFLYHWLDLEDLDGLVKDDELFPDFNHALAGDLRKSFDAFIDEVVQSETSDFRQLMQADWSVTNDRIAKFYGQGWSATLPETELSRTIADSTRHVGVLTHPLLMSHFAHTKTTSPIHRGVFLSRYVLGRVIRPPQEAFTPLDEKLHPDLTTRQRIELQTGENTCQVCHRKINSLGFALEQFDAVGRFRETEQNKTVDPSGSYQPRVGELVEFDDARQLGDYLAGSPDCHQAFVEAAFEHWVKQPCAAYGAKTSENLLKSFRQSGYHMRELIVEIAAIAAAEAIGQPGT